MVKSFTPTIPDDKRNYFKEELALELSQLFEWKNLPDAIPRDYLERNLIRHGQVLFYENENIGLDILRCEVTGFNRHDQPVRARAYTHSTVEDSVVTERRIRYLTESESVLEDFDRATDGVIIRNMSNGQSAWEIIEHFADRLVMAQLAFDTNLLYASMPYIFQTSNEDTILSVKKMFSSIWKGEPLVVVDNELFKDNKDRIGLPTDIPFIAKEIFDVKNEIKMDFRQRVGFDTAGVEKAERVNTLEIESNTQHTSSVLQVMKEQREIAAKAINAFFGTNIEVYAMGEQEKLEYAEEVEENGTDDGGTSEPPQD